MNFLNNINTFVKGDDAIKKTIKDLKDQNDILIQENDILKKSYFDPKETTTSNRIFDKVFADVKTAFFDDNSKIKNNSIEELKKFLSENNLFYTGLSNSEYEFINELDIKELDININPNILKLKQRILERNFSNLMLNMTVNDKMKDLEKELNLEDNSTIINKSNPIEKDINYNSEVNQKNNKIDKNDKEISKNTLNYNYDSNLSLNINNNNNIESNVNQNVLNPNKLENTNDKSNILNTNDVSKNKINKTNKNKNSIEEKNIFEDLLQYDSKMYIKSNNENNKSYRSSSKNIISTTSDNKRSSSKLINKNNETESSKNKIVKRNVWDIDEDEDYF